MAGARRGWWWWSVVEGGRDGWLSLEKSGEAGEYLLARLVTGEKHGWHRDAGLQRVDWLADDVTTPGTEPDKLWRTPPSHSGVHPLTTQAELHQESALRTWPLTFKQHLSTNTDRQTLARRIDSFFPFLFMLPFLGGVC